MKYLGLLFAIIGILMIISGAIASNIMYANLKKENQELKERLERINNYLYKYYSMENQYWFDRIRDIVEDM